MHRLLAALILLAIAAPAYAQTVSTSGSVNANAVGGNAFSIGGALTIANMTTSGDLAYVSSSGNIGQESVSAALATLASTQGDILYYNGSAWVGLAPGTSGDFLETQGASANPLWAAVPSGSISVSGGGNTTTGVSTVAFGNGFVSTPSGSSTTATVNLSLPFRTVTSSPTIGSGDLGGIIYSNVSGGGTLTIPATSTFVSGASVQVTNYSASTEAVSTTPTVNAGGGCVSGTGIPSGDTWFMTSNGTSIDCAQTVSAGGSSGISGLTTGQLGIAGSATTLTSSIAYGATGTNTIVETNGSGALAAGIIPFGTATNTVAEGGVITAGGPTGSATVAPIITYNAAGQLTTVSSATITPAIGSVTGWGSGVEAAAASATNAASGFCVIGSNSCDYKTATIGWIAGVNPNNALAMVIPANSTLVSIVGNVETAVGSTATVSVNVAASGTACSAGTTVHSGSFNANGTAATNQTLTLTTTSVSSGSRLCLQSSGGSDWTSGSGVGGLTVTYTTP